jgi:hypothetical protein
MIRYGLCKIVVHGVDIHCPLCTVLVKSGEKHECSQMEPSYKPKRIQRKRVAGWRMPANAVSVTRPGKFGNPFLVGMYVMLGDGKNMSGLSYMICLDPKRATPAYTHIETPEQAVNIYREYRRRFPLSKAAIAEIRGKDLACWCPLNQVCHADVLLEIANG